jgi:uncharacterized protein YvpB
LLALTCRAEWIDVPFVAQHQNGCEAAATAMVMQYWGAKGFGAAGKASDAATISNSIHSGETNGMAGARIGEYFRRQRFDAYVFAGGWEDLAWHVARGRPLIVCVRNGGSQAPLRYVVVAGLYEKQGVVFVNDAARRKLDRIDRQSFENDWKAGGNWTLLALPQRPR